MTKPVLYAGLLGGLLGAVFSFVLSRALPPTSPKPPVATPSEARQYAEGVMDLLRSGKHDEFMAKLRPAFPDEDEEAFGKIRQGILEGRKRDAKLYGGASEFEFCRETSLSPTLVRLVYLEKYPNGCVVWSMILYQSPSGWQVVSCVLLAPARAAGPPLQ